MPLIAVIILATLAAVIGLIAGWLLRDRGSEPHYPAWKAAHQALDALLEQLEENNALAGKVDATAENGMRFFITFSLGHDAYHDVDEDFDQAFPFKFRPR